MYNLSSILRRDQQERGWTVEEVDDHHIKLKKQGQFRGRFPQSGFTAKMIQAFVEEDERGVPP